MCADQPSAQSASQRLASWYCSAEKHSHSVASFISIVSLIVYVDHISYILFCFFFFQAEDGIRDTSVTGVQTCALPIYKSVAQKGGKRHPAFTVQLSDELGGREASGARSATLFGDAYLATGPTTLKFAQPVHDKVSFAVSLIGGTSAAVSAEVKCVLRPEALAEWQNTVYDLLLDAWRAWDREWRLQQAQTIGPQLSAIDATSPARNLQLITEELKRQVIAWLLDNDNFAGVDAMAAAANGWPRYSIDQARATAPVIQFLEQALEWGNLTYVPYPYYWA